ncbi:DUF1853 family protein [Microbulbifer guangxiensis]|uniref:DUF1853 family protein n=1 Tax=Microbulbifer guangxiensis TaxID=2904249 RepID=UPI001F1E7D73|nr:DUF1853 family protein [Microbulbifer guangxiensis]
MTDYSPIVEPDHWANLLWSLGAPHIVRDCGLPLLPPERQAELRDFFAAPAERARLQPALEEFLAGQGTPRLGIYFEHLWAFAFQHHPHYQLLARNLPLRENGRTLGELDFLVHYLPDQCSEHWELAVKFYLQVDHTHWVGPGLRDRLDTKLARMRDHQLPIAETPLARAILGRRSIEVSRQWAVVPGRLFRPVQAPPPLTAEINPALCDFWWITTDEFTRHFPNSDWRWAPLPKQAWLDDAGYRLTGGVDSAQLAAILQTGPGSRPWCVAARFRGREVSRGFIVAGDWHERAVRSLETRD